MLVTNKLTIALITFAVVIISVILHEVMHGFIAKKLGDDTADRGGRLTLNPLAHIDPIMTIALPLLLAVTGNPIFGAAKPVPVLKHKLKWNDFGMAIVAISGPLTNLVLACIGGLIFRISGLTNFYWSTWWLYFVAINIGFFLFNLIPLPPLDGSRVLYAFAPDFLQKIMDQIEHFGFYILLLLVLLGFPILGNVLNALYSGLSNLLTGISL